LGHQKPSPITELYWQRTIGTHFRGRENEEIRLNNKKEGGEVEISLGTGGKELGQRKFQKAWEGR